MAIAIANAIDEPTAVGHPSRRPVRRWRTFCSGMDLKAFPARRVGDRRRPRLRRTVRATACQAIDCRGRGPALAGGLELAIACDLIVAADTARFGIPEVKRGLVAGAGGLLRLPRQIPQRVAMEMALTGEPISAHRAYELGLINRIVPTGQALQAAQTMAKSIAANAGLAVACSKKVIIESREWPNDQMFAHQAPSVRAVFTSEDAREGAAAFAEKRPPRWKNR